VAQGERPGIDVEGLAPGVGSANVLRPVRQIQLYEQISEQIAARIRSGVWKPGDRLPPERELAKTLGVSRPSVREALASLQMTGLLETRHGTGSFIAQDAVRIASSDQFVPRDAEPPDVSPLALLEAREVLEAEIARVAATRLDDDVELAAQLRVMRENLDPRDPRDRAVWSDADRLFHRQIAVITRNPVFIQFADFVAMAMDEPLWRSLRDEALMAPGRLAEYVHQHQAIYDAIHARAPARSAHHAAEHVRRVKRHMELD
jgi:DNA-binding FadR family transcriptional regulator